MYYLMNKDRIVLEFDIDKSNVWFDDVVFKEGLVTGNLPLGFKNITDWIENRKASKHNGHLKAIMAQFGCDNNEGFIRVTHAAGINDTFWIKSDKESIEWKDISLYRNDFTETVSRLAFEGIGLYDTIFSSTSPEFSCDGSYRKCFRKEKNKGDFGSDIYIYKRGSDIVRIEPYCEMLASEIACIISPQNAVRYQTETLHNKLASKCNLFTSENTGFAAFGKVSSDRSLTEAFRFFETIGSEQQFREMLVIDALCFNQDRHTGNYGVLFDNDSVEIIKMSPVFDLNISMFAYASDLSRIGDVLFDYAPKLGNDFTRMGQIAANAVIQDRIKDLKDYSFTFRGDENFSPERVKLLEKIIQKQATALLSKEKLYTKDVFMSFKYKEYEESKEKVERAVLTAQHFAKAAENISLSNDTFIAECIDTGESLSKASAEITFENGPYIIDIDFLNEKCTLLYNMKECELSQLKKDTPSFYSDYKNIKKAICVFDEKIGKKMFNGQNKAGFDYTDSE